MPELLSLFQASFPSVKVYLKEGSSQDIADDLMEFKYDLGIIGRLPHLNKLKAVPYTREEFRLVMPDIVFPREIDLSPPAQAFLRLIEGGT